MTVNRMRPAAPTPTAANTVREAMTFHDMLPPELRKLSTECQSYMDPYTVKNAVRRYGMAYTIQLFKMKRDSLTKAELFHFYGPDHPNLEKYK